MKGSLIALVVVSGAVIVAHPTYANEENVHSATPQQGQAALLQTKPISIESQTSHIIYRINNRRPTPVPIGVVREQKCKDINPLDFIKDPATNLKLCSKPQQNSDSESKPTEPANYYKVPPLESGIRVPVSKF